MKLKKIENSSLFKDLQDPNFAASYLEEMLLEDNLNDFLIALRNVSKANGGITSLAESTQLGRESLYKTLSEQGNPYFLTINTIIKNLGFKIAIEVDCNKEEAA